jgi:hypothetical protein
MVAESGAKNLVNVSLPHKFTGTVNLGFILGKKKSTALYFIERYENYEQMYRFVTMFGLNISINEVNYEFNENNNSYCSSVANS